MRQSGIDLKVNAAIQSLAKRLDSSAFADPVSPRFSMLMRRRVALQRADRMIADVKVAEGKIKALLRKKAQLDAQVRALEATLDPDVLPVPKIGRSSRAVSGLAGTRVAPAAGVAKPANDDNRRRAALKPRVRSAERV